MSLSEFSVKNTLLVNCLTFFLIIWGIFSLFKTKREAFPNFSFDVVMVKTEYLGASPDIIEKRITSPLEKELKEVDDIEKMDSFSLEGLSLVFLTIDPDAKNKDKVVTNIERAVQQVSDLPSDLKQKPQVDELETKDTPIVEVALSGNLPEEKLRHLAIDLEAELLDVDEISKVVRKGMRDPEIWVQVDPSKMQEHQISFAEVMQSLSARNINISGGFLKGKEKELIIRTTGEFESINDVGSVVLRGNEEGHWVQVVDIAKVTPEFEEKQESLRTDGTRAINLFLLKKNSADAIRLTEKVKDVVLRFQKKAPPELKVAYVNDLSYYIKRRLHVLTSNGWMGLFLVLIPMIFFLSLETTIGAAMGIGTAILTTFAVMNYFGITVNLISMFGMIMVLGMLVDEDLVVADNITRYHEMGVTGKEAAIKGVGEVQPAIISTVLTTIVAFLPLLFMSGIFGKFVKDIPRVVMITLTASLMEAMIILPAHLAGMDKSKDESNQKKEEGTFQRKRREWFEQLRDKYLSLLRWCFDRPYKVTFLAFVLMAFSIFYALFGMKFILFPAKGIEAFFIRAEAPVGTRLEVMEDKMKVLEALTAKLPTNELDHYVTQVGIMQNDPNDPFTIRGSHVSQIQVFLTPETARDRDADQIMKELRERFDVIPERNQFNRVSFDAVNTGPPVGKPVAVKIRGEDYRILSDLAEVYKEELKSLPGVRDIRSDYEEGKGELRVVIDEKKAQQSGLNYEDLAMTVRQAFGGMQATKIRKGDEEIDVLVRLPIERRFDQATLESLLVKNKMGNMVSLSQVSHFEEVPGLSEIKHFDSKRVVTVTANIDESVTSSRDVNLSLKRKFEKITEKYPGYSVKYGGEEEDTEKSLNTLLFAFSTSMLMIFFILLVTFQSLLQTLIIMISIPFGLVGVVLGLSLSGEPFSFLAILGMIGLTGIVVDGGTLIFVFMNNLRKEGMGRKESIIQACRIRLRSLILTTLTTVLGVIPAAYGIGGQDPFIRPMALAMDWGLAISVFFSIFFLPVLFFVAEENIDKVKKYLFKNK